MADISTCAPLTRSSVQAAHKIVKPYVHRTPVLTCSTLDKLASTPQDPAALQGTPYEGRTPARPKINLFFKCENYQRIGAFKARGAFHALSRLTDEQCKKGVVTHSSGNHAQALALAAHTRGVKAYIVMPHISTPSKIAGTKSYGAEVIFSGSTSTEREAVVADVIARTGATLVPPYDHPDIILGQGTLALELEEQVAELLSSSSSPSSSSSSSLSSPPPASSSTSSPPSSGLHAVIAPCGGGGMLSGVATALSGTGTLVFGSEPSFQGADDAGRGLAQGKRIEAVKTLTIADGLRTPLGAIPWSVLSQEYDPNVVTTTTGGSSGSSSLGSKRKLHGMFSATESQIKAAMKLVLERMKVVIEPSAAVPLAVVLFNEDFRILVEKLQHDQQRKQDHGQQAGDVWAWNLGVVFSGGNTTVEAIARLFGSDS
ncbi:IlvA, threonine dehydratase [Xylona heveae TC161]|uniref:IlvA, threonine dehydratase n=1 Tax=Xylona heveae (strain CBS 132557 / TC161) TaxID=1328760 RepID=A0A164ZF71_XYLHT|nr:IlvA, threonine dehydratase [Xylona heveae TC161]KZF19027.1 IlvA, threonine dehydratase [Xylona heveae TC161]